MFAIASIFRIIRATRYIRRYVELGVATAVTNAVFTEVPARTCSFITHRAKTAYYRVLPGNVFSGTRRAEAHSWARWFNKSHEPVSLGYTCFRDEMCGGSEEQTNERNQYGEGRVVDASTTK